LIAQIFGEQIALYGPRLWFWLICIPYIGV
jgi:hypothetical protein